MRQNCTFLGSIIQLLTLSDTSETGLNNHPVGIQETSVQKDHPPEYLVLFLILHEITDENQISRDSLADYIS